MNTINPQVIWQDQFGDANIHNDFAGIPIQFDQYMKIENPMGWELLDIGNCNKSIEKGKFLRPVAIQTHKVANKKPVFSLSGTVYQVRRIGGKRINYEIVAVDKIEIQKKKLQVEEDLENLLAINVTIMESLVGKLNVEEVAMFTTAFISKGFATKYNSEVKNIPLTSNNELATLGDGILKSILTEYLFHIRAEKGGISMNRQKLESNQHLAEMGNKLNLKPISIESEKDAVRLMANIMEALVGIIHLLFGNEYTKRFVRTYLFN